MATNLGIPKPRSIEPDETTVDVTGRPHTPALVDRYGRSAIDLRVSLTDFCNLRCTYCMPEAGLEFLKRQQLMSVDEVVRFVRIAVEHLGIEQVRFTGGEPLTRADLAEIIAGVAQLSPRPDISLTTNAIGLGSRAHDLVRAGLNRVNISLDSVQAATFETMTRRPLLHRVLEGIDAAVEAGLSPIKINAVLQPGVNDHEAPDLLAWSLDRGFQLRIIEYMPLDGGGQWSRQAMVTAGDAWRILTSRFDLVPVAEPRGGAPAELFHVYPMSATREPREPFHGIERPVGVEPLGTVGIIASVTRPFCGECTRTRLTAEGRVRTCLFSRTETDLLHLMRSGHSDDAIAERWRAAQWGKQAGHGMQRPDFVQPERPMSAIGG